VSAKRRAPASRHGVPAFLASANQFSACELVHLDFYVRYVGGGGSIDGCGSDLWFRGQMPTTGVSMDVFVSRLHDRYVAAHLPADLVFQTTGDRGELVNAFVEGHDAARGVPLGAGDDHRIVAQEVALHATRAGLHENGAAAPRRELLGGALVEPDDDAAPGPGEWTSSRGFLEGSYEAVRSDPRTAIMVEQNGVSGPALNGRRIDWMGRPAAGGDELAPHEIVNLKL